MRVTELGRRVLAGDADRVEVLGIDRWVGGTHLSPGAVWRWDGAVAGARRTGRLTARSLIPRGTFHTFGTKASPTRDDCSGNVGR